MHPRLSVAYVSIGDEFIKRQRRLLMSAKNRGKYREDCSNVVPITSTHRHAHRLHPILENHSSAVEQKVFPRMQLTLVQCGTAQHEIGGHRGKCCTTPGHAAIIIPTEHRGRLFQHAGSCCVALTSSNNDPVRICCFGRPPATFVSCVASYTHPLYYIAYTYRLFH